VDETRKDFIKENNNPSDMSDSESTSMSSDAAASSMSSMWLLGAVALVVLFLVVYIAWPNPTNITATGTITAPHGNFTSTLTSPQGTFTDVSQSNYAHGTLEGKVGGNAGTDVVIEFDTVTAEGITFDDSTFAFTVAKSGFYAANLSLSSVVNGHIIVKNETTGVVVLQSSYDGTAKPQSVGGTFYATEADEFKAYYNFSTTATFDAAFDLQCVNVVTLE
jgi:hypothetical protein